MGYGVVHMDDLVVLTFMSFSIVVKSYLKDGKELWRVVSDCYKHVSL